MSQPNPDHKRSETGRTAAVVIDLFIDDSGAGKRLPTGIFDSVHMVRLISFSYRKRFSIRAFMLRRYW